MNADHALASLGKIDPPNPADLDAAAKYVSRALGDDCSDVLDMLGIGGDA